MASYRNTFGDLLEPGFRQIFDDVYAELPLVFPSLLHVNTSTKQDEKDSGVSGFGLMALTGEGEQVDYEDPVQLFDYRYIHQKYTKGFKVSEELVEDDQYNVINKKPAALARSARRTSEYQAAQLFNNAFSASQLGGDGKPLISTLHPRADGGTSQSNASATGIPLTDANLEVARTAFRNQVDDKGMKIQAMPDTLLVPIGLEKTAETLVNSNMKAGSADNDLNFNRGKYKIVSWEYLTNSTAWFLIDSRMSQLNWFWRVKPEFKQDTAFDTGMALFKCRARFSKGFSDYRGIWGSLGGGQAYAL